jgi:hypothetical protein
MRKFASRLTCPGNLLGLQILKGQSHVSIMLVNLGRFLILKFS